MDDKSQNIDESLDREFTSILTRLNEILLNSGNNPQADYVSLLIKLLQLKKYDQFISSINTVDMWGGAGAVWEVYIENKSNEMEFERHIVHLIDTMEKADLSGKRIKRIRKLFTDDLSKL